MLKLFYLNVNSLEFVGGAPEWLQPYVAEETYVGVLEFRSVKARMSRLLGEWLVRRLLFRYCGWGGDDFAIVRKEHGKPYITGGDRPVFYNISHSGDYLLCALSDTEVGVDIERVEVARMNVAERFFHPAEIKSLQYLSGKEQDDLFFRYWAAKESFLKYTGKGLTRPLSSFTVCFMGEQAGIYEGEVRLPVYVRECVVDKGYKCYICSGLEQNVEIYPVVHRF